MSTAATPVNGNDPLEFSWDSEYATSEYYIYMHFAEVVELQPNQSRSFNITVNGNHWYGPLAPNYLKANTLYSTSATSGSAKYEVSIFKTENSTLPPIINAFEIYSVKYLLQSETNQEDGTLFHTHTHIYIYIYMIFTIRLVAYPSSTHHRCM
jgi:hypothetical protein